MKLSIGQKLLTTTNEYVTITDLYDELMTVQYRGKEYLRPQSIVGDKLFPIETQETLSTTPTCENCMDYRNGNCFGKNSACEEYRHVPTISQAERDAWPEFGDATYYRKHKRKVQLERNYK